MSSTNKTTYYELPQFVDSDLFNPLVDDNDAYDKIDTALHQIAEAEADDASEIVDVKGRVTTVEGKVDALETQNGNEVLTTTAQTLSGAVNELDGDVSSLDGRLDVVEDDINNVNTGLKVKVSALETQNGAEVLTTTAQTLSGAINELVSDDADIINLIKSGFVTPEMFGAVGDGVTDDTNAIQSAINTEIPVLFANKVYLYTSLVLPKKVTMIGNGTTLKNTDYSGGGDLVGSIQLNPSIKDYDGIKVYGITFDGNKSAETNEYYGVFLFNLQPYTNGSLKHVYFEKCTFVKFKNNAIMVVMNLSSAVDGIGIYDCIFDGVTRDDTKTIGDGFRIQLGFAYYVGHYGEVFAKNIYMSHCYGHYIRTLYDIKRGCTDFEISDCNMLDIEDCYISVDGSFNGIISNCVMECTSDFDPWTGTNFLELQSENLLVTNLIMKGGGVMRDGIFVTPYEYPTVEYRNPAKNIIIADCYVENINNVGFRFTGSNKCTIKNCIVDGALQAVGFDSTVYQDKDGNDFQLIDCVAFGIQDKNTTNHFVIANRNKSDIIASYSDDAGFPYIYNYETLNIVSNFLADLGKPVNSNYDLVAYDTDKPAGYYTIQASCTNHPATNNVVPYVTVEDFNTSFVGALAKSIYVKKGDMICVKVKVAKADTNTQFGIFFQEYNGTTFINSTLKGYDGELSDGFKEYMVMYKVTDDNATRLIIGLTPNNTNVATHTGSFNISSFEIYR